MNCTICCQPTLLGAKLCTACRSALKRARDESVLELPKRREAAARDRRRTPRPAPASATDSAAMVGTPVRLLRGWSGYAALAALAVTVLTVGYLSGRSSDASETPVAIAAAPSRVVPLPALAPAVTPQQAPRAALPAPAVQATERVEISPTPSVSPQELVVKAPASRPAPTPATAKEPATATAKEPALRPGGSAPPVDSDALAAFGYGAEPARRSRPARVAAAPQMAVTQVASDPDRWAILTDLLNRCGREAFFSRPSCEQRARAQHCGGFWGQTAQCPNPIQNDHTR